jgi:hypothetical protein
MCTRVLCGLQAAYDVQVVAAELIDMLRAVWEERPSYVQVSQSPTTRRAHTDAPLRLLAMHVFACLD